METKNETPDGREPQYQGDKIRHLRTKVANKVLRDVESETKIPISTLSAIETNKARASLEDLMSLSQYFGIDVEELVNYPLNPELLRRSRRTRALSEQP